MGSYSGVEPNWAARTNAGRTHIATKGIVQNGLVLNLDSGASSSYGGSGTTWTDLSGNGNNGTLVNGVGFSIASNSNGGSMVFDGVNDYVTLGTPSLLNGVQVPLTICVWAIANSFGSFNALWAADKSLSGGGLYSLFRVDSGVLKYFASTSAGGFQSQGTLTPSTNVWNFYAVTVSGSISSPSVTIYLNTSSQTFSYSALSSSPDLTVDFRIGGSQRTGVDRFNGNITNVSWYNRALTEAEIQQNFNATRGRYGI